MAPERLPIQRATALLGVLEDLDPTGDEDRLARVSARELLEAVGAVGELTRIVAAVGVHLAGEVVARSSSATEGSLAMIAGEKSAARLISRVAEIDPVVANDWCAAAEVVRPRTALTGETLPARYPNLARAQSAAVLDPGSVRRLGHTLDELSAQVSTEELARLEQTLVEHSAGLSTRQHHGMCRTVLDRYTPETSGEREELLRARSGVQISRTGDGLVRWTVSMHPEAAGILTAAIDARTAPRRTPVFESGETPADDIDPVTDRDVRSLAQRRLDALVDLARDSLRHDPGDVGGTAVTMLVTVDLETLRSGVGSARIAGVDEPISASTARRLAAGADLIPVVLGGESEPLDLGRSRRLFSPAQRRALAIRDRGCLWPGCSAPPGWCEIAHVTPWAAGGATDLDNAVMLCPFHHRRFDLDGWSLTRQDGRRVLVPPPWVDAGLRPRVLDRRDVAA